MKQNVVPFRRHQAERRRQAEREFLPAALEIIETPVSVTGRFMMGSLVVLIAIAVAWACIGKVDIVASANGRLIPSGQVKVIQPLEIGVVKKISVTDGDHVAAGDELVELDATSDAADRDKIAHDLMQAELDAARLRAVLLGDAAAFTPPQGADPALADTERRQLGAQLAEERAKIAGLNQQVAAKVVEQEQARAIIGKLEASLPILQQKADIYHKLRENEFTSKVAMLAADQQVVEAKHDRIVAATQVLHAQAEAAGLVEQRDETAAEFRRQAFDDLRKATQYAAEQREELIKAKRRAGLQILRAPVAGTVEQLAVHTVGGVVTPAQALMVVVPDGSKLELEAMLPNRDAGFVHAGQPAELKVEAFNYTRYGLLHGLVRVVSRDALRSGHDPAGADAAQAPGQAAAQAGNGATGDSAYVVRVAVAESAMRTEQGTMPLEPGMAVTAEIRTGDRRIIEYLMSPFMRYSHEAFRER